VALSSAAPSQRGRILIRVAHWSPLLHSNQGQTSCRICPRFKYNCPRLKGNDIGVKSRQIIENTKPPVRDLSTARHIIKTRLADFNARWLIKYAGMHKNGTRTIKVITDFMDELKEAEVIAIAKDAGIITKDIWKIMDEKLGKRNSAAHASGVAIG